MDTTSVIPTDSVPISTFRDFKDVTIYTPNYMLGNIIRVDATWMSIWVAPYAQYKEAVYIEYIPKGKRKTNSMLCSGDAPYVVVVLTECAIKPDDLYLPAVGGVSEARYGAADPRWRNDFDAQLLSGDVPILLDFRDLGAGPPVSKANQGDVPLGDTSPARLPESDVVSEAMPEDLEYEEGSRQLREQYFFKRNQELVNRAKEVYGCVCQACGFDFALSYGALGTNFAEVHHLNPLSERTADKWTNTVLTNLADVAVLCANCHRMIHRHKPALSIQELKAILASNTDLP